MQRRVLQYEISFLTGHVVEAILLSIRSSESPRNFISSTKVRQVRCERFSPGGYMQIRGRILYHLCSCLLQCDVQLAHFNLVRDDARFVPKLVREVSVLDFLRGSDGHYYKGRSRQLLPAIPRRTKYPSNADVSTDSGSYKGNGPLQEDATHTTDQQKVRSIYTMIYLTVVLFLHCCFECFPVCSSYQTLFRRQLLLARKINVS